MLDVLLFVLFDFLSPLEIIEVNITCSSWYKLVDEYFTKIFPKKIQNRYPSVYNETINWKNKILFLKNKKLPILNFNYTPNRVKIFENKSAFINLKFKFKSENQIYQECFDCSVDFDDDVIDLEYTETFFYKPEVVTENKKREFIRQKIYQELKFFEDFNLLNGNRLLDIIPLLDAFENNYKFQCIRSPTFEKLTLEEFLNNYQVSDIQNLKDALYESPKEFIPIDCKNSYIVHSDETLEIQRNKKIILYVYRTIELKLGGNDWCVSSNIDFSKLKEI
jgi:hypothetical protein